MRTKKSKMKLWYRQPAKEWTEALPIGNGRLGGMVFSGTEVELINLNEDTLWSGVPGEKYNFDAVNHLDKVRDLIFKGQFSDAQKLIEDKMLGTWTESYQSMGDVYIDFGIDGDIQEYYRELDLEKAVVTTTYKYKGSRYVRQTFASNPHQIIVLRVSCELPGRVNLKADMNSLLRHSVFEIDDFSLAMRGKSPEHVEPIYINCENPVVYNEGGRGIDFEVQIKVIPKGGWAKCVDKKIYVKDADAVTILIAAHTSFSGYNREPGSHGENCSKLCKRTLESLKNIAFDDLLKAHIDDCQKLFKRVELNLGSNDRADLPTDERLVEFKKDSNDPQLAALFFQYGRYLLISCSRPETQPANLQGIWNNEVRPPWSSNYTTNINTEMNYWPAEVCNLAECHEPLFDMIKELSVTGQKTAKIQYNCKGWVANHNVDLWRQTSPVGGCASWAYWPMAGAWLCQHLWEHYAFSMDKEFLRETAYPLMKGAAQFCLNWLVEGKDSFLVTCPSTSPENFFITEKGDACSVSMASTMDMSIIRELFINCIDACKILEIDRDFKQQLEKSVMKLYPYKIGKYGQLQEWFDDFKEKEPGHRHLSHLFSLYPGKEILKKKDTKLLEACCKTLERRITNGGGQTGWSCAWIINLYARLEDAENAYKFVNTLLSKSTYPNLFHAYPPFQIDGNFGGTAGIAEMLLQSHTDEISLLPALPIAWANGSVKGLKARGGFEVDMVWENCNLVNAVIYSNYKGRLRVRTKSPIKIVYEGENVVFRDIFSCLVEMECENDRMYSISTSGNL